MGERFLNLLEESVIFQGILVLLIFGTIAYMVITGQDVPKELWAMAGVVAGYFFGGKAVIGERRTAAEVARAIASGQSDKDGG